MTINEFLDYHCIAISTYRGSKPWISPFGLARAFMEKHYEGMRMVDEEELKGAALKRFPSVKLNKGKIEGLFYHYEVITPEIRKKLLSGEFL